MSAGQQTGRSLKPGDVLAYMPIGSWHCREGRAVVNERGIAVDTFWSFGNDGSAHRLSDAELEGAELKFNLGDYREVRYAAEWLPFAPADRGIVTAQSGYQRRYYVREGAAPDLSTQIENAREKVAEAERAVEWARSTLEWRRRELAELEAQR